MAVGRGRSLSTYQERSMILVTFGHTFLWVAGAALVCGILGYAFRGKESKAIRELGDSVKKEANKL